MKKKILSVFLVLCLIFTLLPVSALADTTASGKCGDNLTWTLKNGTLTISGTGAMYDYSYQDNWKSAPWFSERKEMKTVVIEDGVTSIGSSAFYICSNLTSITIGKNVKSIGNWAFFYCDALKDVNYTGTNQQWKKITVGENNECLTDANIHCSDGDLVKPKYCGSNVTWTYENGTLTISGKGAMYDYYDYGATPWSAMLDEIKTVVIKNGVTSIGNYAFSNCRNMTSATIGNSVKSIGAFAFFDCSSLASITIPASVKSIGDEAFFFCDKLKSISVSKDNSSFCSVNGVLFNKDKTRLIQYPIAKADTSYSVPNTVKIVETNAFYGCTNIKNVTIPGSVTSIGEWAFSDCTGLKSITIPSGVTSIQYGSFRNCSSLASVSIPSSVKKIVSKSFFNCDSLKDVYYSGSSTQWKSINISKVGNDTLLKAKLHCSGSTVAAPAAPVIKITTSAGKPKISWSAVDGATKYYIYRSTDGKTYKQYTTTTKTSYTNSKATIGTTYYYKVKAAKVVNDKTVKSVYSNVKSIKCTPAAPVVSISRSSGKPKLTWKAVTGASKYYIYRSTDGKTYKQYTTTTKTTYTNTGAASGKKYYYKVKAVAVVNKKNVFSAYSSAKNLMTTIATPTVSITTVNGKPKITWKAVTGADKYIVYRSTDGKTFKQLSTTTKTSLTNTGAKKNTKYYYKVKAVCTKNTSANSALSKAVSIKATK